MNRLEQAEQLAHVVAAFVRAFANPAQPRPSEVSLLDVLAEQVAQSESIFAFGVIERSYDCGVGRIDGITNRIAVLLAAQIAIEAVLIDKVNTFGSGPNLLVFVTIVATALFFRAGGEADFIDADTFSKTFGDHPRQTRDALLHQLCGAITRNKRIVRSRQRLFSVALVVTIGALGWAFW